jgi:DNA excision repair protein ERCC-6
MLNIFEDLLKSKNYKYLRMDGSTNISERQDLIDKFNQDESIFIFILTTKVGGIGINLTGADRILIYDPDCNSIFIYLQRESVILI